MTRDTCSPGMEEVLLEEASPHYYGGSLALPLLLIAAFIFLWNTWVTGEGAWRGAVGGRHDTHHHVT